MNVDAILTQLQATTPLFVVISGPSGVGKDAIIAHMKDLNRPYHFAVTCTTRPKRPKEIDGIDYSFITQTQFTHMLTEGAFIEYASVYGNQYGVPRDPLITAMNNQQDIIIKTDVQGARTLKQLAPEGTFIMLLPPSQEVLRKRLTNRATETSHDLETRLNHAILEIQQSSVFTHKLINIEGDIPATVAQVENILVAERMRVKKGLIQL
jgi:guanylate kinase